MNEFKYKGYTVYPYIAGTVGNRRNVLCIADPNHNYPYEAKGVTLASGFKSNSDAMAYIDKYGKLAA